MIKTWSTTVTEEGIRTVFALVALVASRWLMDISNPQKDWRTLKLWYHNFVWEMRRIKWYSGVNVLHQLRASKLLGR